MYSYPGRCYMKFSIPMYYARNDIFLIFIPVRIAVFRMSLTNRNLYKYLCNFFIEKMPNILRVDPNILYCTVLYDVKFKLDHY
jgi:hypothetical protein